MTVLDTARRRATRAKLVEAAIGEFAKRGIDATSVEHLCEAAGFTRGAFYSNFATKDDLCIEIACHIARETTERFRGALQEMPTVGSSPAETLLAILDVTHISPETHTTQVEMALRAAREPEFSKRLSAAREDLWPIYIEVAEQAATRANVRFTIPVPEALRIIEALHYSPTHMGYNQESRHTIRLAADLLLAPLGGEDS